MTPEAPELRSLAARLDALGDRLQALEVRVPALVTSPTEEATEFILRDERGEIRARLGMPDYAPRLTFYDRVGTELLRIGLRRDGAPTIQLGEREFRWRRRDWQNRGKRTKTAWRCRRRAGTRARERFGGGCEFGEADDSQGDEG